MKKKEYKPTIILEIVMNDGERYQMVAVCRCSTSVGMQQICHKNAVGERDVMLFRVYEDSALVREWDEQNQTYTLEIA